MTDTMIDRVAKALEQRFRDTIAAAAGVPFINTGVTSPAYSVWLDYARTAVAAMREPTEAMARVGGWADGVSGTLAADIAWRHMIDVALEGK